MATLVSASHGLQIPTRVREHHSSSNFRRQTISTYGVFEPLLDSNIELIGTSTKKSPKSSKSEINDLNTEFDNNNDNFLTPDKNKQFQHSKIKNNHVPVTTPTRRKSEHRVIYKDMQSIRSKSAMKSHHQHSTAPVNICNGKSPAFYSLHQPQGNLSYGYRRSGYLLKKSEAKVQVKPWRKRRCEVLDGCLYIFHSDKRKAPTKLNLLTCQVKSYIYDDIKFYFDLISFNRTYHFQAYSQDDLTAWVSVLINCKEEALKEQFHNKSSRLHHNYQHQRSQSSHCKTPSLSLCDDVESQNLNKTKRDDQDGDLNMNNCENYSVDRSMSSLQLTQQSIIAHIKAMHGNQECVDCGAKDPTWLSTNLGVLVCIECSGIHREMGVNVSRIQSLVLDNIGTSHLLIAKNIGNKLFNEFFEFRVPSQNDEEDVFFNLPPKPFPHSSMDVKSEFIRAKYLQRQFSNRSSLIQTILERQQDVKQAIVDCNLTKMLQLFSQSDIIKSIPFENKDKGNHDCDDQDLMNIFFPIHLALEMQAKSDDKHKFMPIIDFLVQNCSNLDIQNPDNGETALHLCVKYNLTESLKLLLRSGANLSTNDNSGFTPLAVALKFKNCPPGCENNCDGCKILEIIYNVLSDKRSILENVSIKWDSVDFLQQTKFGSDDENDEIPSSSGLEYESSDDEDVNTPPWATPTNTPMKNALKTAAILGLSSVGVRGERSSSLLIDNCCLHNNEGRYRKLESEQYQEEFKDPEHDGPGKTAWTPVNNKQLTSLFCRGHSAKNHSSNFLPFNCDSNSTNSPKVKALRSLVSKPQKILKIQQLWHSSIN